jgi:Bacterial PH domain
MATHARPLAWPPPVPGWDDKVVRPQKFRHNAAITIAAVVAFFGAVPLATSRVYLLPIMLVPILIGIWGWRAGTDVSPAGLRVRALFGARLVPWSHVAALVPAGRGRVYAILTTGRRVRLPAVGAADLPKITGSQPKPEPETPEPEAQPAPETGNQTEATPTQAQ